jgi:hypothetical protein
MSKKKTPDAHKSGFLIRLPEAYRPKLQEHKSKTGCPFSEAVRRAVDAYLKANGVAPPSQSGE